MESNRDLILQWIEQDAIKKEDAENTLKTLNVLPSNLQKQNMVSSE